MTFNAFFHDFFTRLKCKIYEKCCNNHHTRPGHTFAIVTISKYVLDLQRVLSVSFIVKTFVNNVVRSVFHKKVLQNKFVQIWVFHDFFHDLLNSMTFPWPIIFHDFSMTFPWPVIFHDFSMTVGTLLLGHPGHRLKELSWRDTGWREWWRQVHRRNTNFTFFYFSFVYKYARYICICI